MSWCIGSAHSFIAFFSTSRKAIKDEEKDLISKESLSMDSDPNLILVYGLISHNLCATAVDVRVELLWFEF